MEYLKISIKTKFAVEDIVANVIQENGIIGVEITDNKNLTEDELKKMYVDIPLLKNDDDNAVVSFYVKIVGEKHIRENIPNNIDNSYKASDDNFLTYDEFDETLNKIKSNLNSLNEFLDMGDLKFDIVKIDDIDYLNNWKRFFKPIFIDDLVIKPNWDNTLYNGTEIRINPGSAFGTGQHETTKLCIKNLKDIIKKYNKKSLLDIGCGSGILGIVAMKLGINKVINIDVDDMIKDTFYSNANCNNIDLKKFEIYFGNLITDEIFYNKIKKDKYDIITANILAPIIIDLINIDIYDLLYDGGFLILSGIIKEKKDDVINSLYKKGISEFKVDCENDWICIVVKK